MFSTSVASRCGLAALSHGIKRSVLGSTRGMKIVSARPVNNGQQVDVEFLDKTSYRFHTAWMKDSSPSQVGHDYYRKSAKTLFEVDKYIAKETQATEDGAKLVVHFQNGATEPVRDEYVATWLHAFAPYVGQPLHGEAKKQGLQGTASLLDDLYQTRKPWDSNVEIPSFDAKEIAESEDLQIELLEKMIDPGMAMIRNLGPPESLGNEDVGMPMEKLVRQIIGRLNQHPVRKTRYGIIHTRPRAEKAGADYDQSNPLSMHTDHSVYFGTPGFLQFMYQAQGTVTSKVCDGLALAEYMRKNHPEDYRLLTTVQLTHSSRNCIYATNGAYRQDDPNVSGATFELVHTHPVLQLDKDGLLEKVVQSETKRGVCALSYDVYEPFMAAYRRWTDLAEDPRFIRSFKWPEQDMIVLNNWRVLHGRASVPPNMERTMCFGYVMKTITENRYRLLKQRQAERKNPVMNDRWLTRLPNQVLYSLVR